LGIKTTNQDKGSLLLELNNYLIERHRKHTTTVLIVDEAQHLGPELLEEIRLLTNLETSQQKLLQIVLVGQPELDLKMDSGDLRQLKQRIALRCQLEPLQEEETKSYILRRLQRAGANSHANTMFPGETITSVYRYSRGIPRLINTVCENALIASYAGKAQSVRPEVIDEVAKDLRLNVLSRPVMVAPAMTSGQRDIAKSLLKLVEALERVTRNADARETSSDPGAKIV
jgi:type II secretory pathway predicted ATPase ExeA